MAFNNIRDKGEDAGAYTPLKIYEGGGDPSAPVRADRSLPTTVRPVDTPPGTSFKGPNSRAGLGATAAFGPVRGKAVENENLRLPQSEIMGGAYNQLAENMTVPEAAFVDDVEALKADLQAAKDSNQPLTANLMQRIYDVLGPLLRKQKGAM